MPRSPFRRRCTATIHSHTPESVGLGPAVEQDRLLDVIDGLRPPIRGALRFAIGTFYLPEDLLQIWLYPVFMIDTDGWESIEPTSPEVFAKYRHDDVVLCIRRGDDWSDDIVVEVIDDGTRRDISRRELMPDALRVARSFMESVTK